MISEWLLEHFARLNAGQMTQLQIAEEFLEPQFISQQKVILAPNSGSLQVDDLVLCVINDCSYFALIKAVTGPTTYLVGNNNGAIFGEASDSDIAGVVINITD